MSAIAKNGIIYQGGTPVIDILNSDLQALIQAGTYDPNVLYNITDLNDNENIIDDENVSNNTTWSSSKINSTLETLFRQSAVNFNNTTLDSFVESGIVSGYFQNVTLGGRVFNNWGALIVIKRGFIMQVAICGNNTATRLYANGTWNAWV